MTTKSTKNSEEFTASLLLFSWGLLHLLHTRAGAPGCLFQLEASRMTPVPASLNCFVLLCHHSFKLSAVSWFNPQLSNARYQYTGLNTRAACTFSTIPHFKLVFFFFTNIPSKSLNGTLCCCGAAIHTPSSFLPRLTRWTRDLRGCQSGWQKCEDGLQECSQDRWCCLCCMGAVRPIGGAGWKGVKMAAATTGESVCRVTCCKDEEQWSLKTVSATDIVFFNEEKAGN